MINQEEEADVPGIRGVYSQNCCFQVPALSDQFLVLVSNQDFA